MYRLSTKQLLAQHALLPGNTSLPSPWELPYGFMEPLFRRIVIPLVDSHLYCFLTTVEPSYPGEHSCACRCIFSTNFRWLMNIWWFNTFFPQESRVAFLLVMIAFHLVTLVHALWPLDLVVTHQFSQASTIKTVWWCNAVLDYTIFDNSLHNVTACYLLKYWVLFKSLSE
jgi:hypothetical protein